jgi:hypothetical protein
MGFRRTFGTSKVIDWDNPSRDIEHLRPGEGLDEVVWSLEASGCFSTSSMYHKLCNGWATVHFKDVWRSKMPTEIKIFMWQMIREELPSCEQICKRHRPSNGECYLCWEVEDANHNMFQCALAKFLWACVRSCWVATGIQ